MSVVAPDKDGVLLTGADAALLAQRGGAATLVRRIRAMANSGDAGARRFLRARHAAYERWRWELTRLLLAEAGAELPVGERFTRFAYQMLETGGSLTYTPSPARNRAVRSMVAAGLLGERERTERERADLRMLGKGARRPLPVIVTEAGHALLRAIDERRWALWRELSAEDAP